MFLEQNVGNTPPERSRDHEEEKEIFQNMQLDNGRNRYFFEIYLKQTKVTHLQDKPPHFTGIDEKGLL